MLVANLRDGQTAKFDLCTAEGLKSWEGFQRKLNGQITGLAISHRKTLHTFPRSHQMTGRDLGADVLKSKSGQVTAERIWGHLGKVRVIFTVYLGKTPVTRVDLKRVGEIRFQPGR